MHGSAGQILTNFAKKRALLDSDRQIPKVRTMQDNAGLCYTPCI